MRYVSDFFKERPPRCQHAETAESEDMERKPSLQIADAERNNHYSYSRPVWAFDPWTQRKHAHTEPLDAASSTITDNCTHRCSDWHYTPIHRIILTRERLHALTLNIIFSTLLRTADCIYSVLCHAYSYTLYAQWGTRLYRTVVQHSQSCVVGFFTRRRLLERANLIQFIYNCTGLLWFLNFFYSLIKLFYCGGRFRDVL